MLFRSSTGTFTINLTVTDVGGNTASCIGSVIASVNAVQDKRLKIVLKEFELEPLPVHLVHPAQALPPLKLRRFLEFALPRLKQALAEIDRRVG